MPPLLENSPREKLHRAKRRHQERTDYSEADLRRFWKKVDKNGPVQPHVPHLGQCWNWIGTKRGKGYGSFRQSVMLSAHRVSWILHHGFIETGKHVLHRCDNTECVNPSHLWLGTNSENAQDCSRKGRTNRASGNKNGQRLHPERTARGERQGSSKLTDSRVVDIRSKYDLGRTARELAYEFGVSKSSIERVLNRSSWRHVK